MKWFRHDVIYQQMSAAHVANVAVYSSLILMHILYRRIVLRRQSQLHSETGAPARTHDISRQSTERIKSFKFA
jgi:hypothetical protein